MSEGEGAGCVGVTEGDVFSDVAIRPALANILRRRVQGRGLRQEVSTSALIKALKPTGATHIIIALLPVCSSFLGAQVAILHMQNISSVCLCVCVGVR